MVHRLKDCSLPAICFAPNGTPGCGPGIYQSNLIRYGVETLHRRHRFDAIVFPSWQAAGFRCVQAKRAGSAFLNTRLIIRLDRLNQWQREAEKRLCTPDDIFLDFCERYTLEGADGQIAASADLPEYMQSLDAAIQSVAPAVRRGDRRGDALQFGAIPTGNAGVVGGADLYRHGSDSH